MRFLVYTAIASVLTAAHFFWDRLLVVGELSGKPDGDASPVSSTKENREGEEVSLSNLDRYSRTILLADSPGPYNKSK